MKLSQGNLQDLVDRLVLWIQDRMQEIGSDLAVVGISGGKDSSVVAGLCAKALGPDKVLGIIMPDGPQGDIQYAFDLCAHLGIQVREISIKPMTQAFWQGLEEAQLPGRVETDQAGRNLPPRVRMTLLYAVAQMTHGVVVNTSNLSEDWVGYATVYGDTAGAFSPLAMLTSDEVVQVGRTLGLPETLVAKPPSDGLTGKTDEDVFGFSYDTLNTYIRTGKIDDPQVKEKIDRMHRVSRFKFATIPMFPANLPIGPEDLLDLYGPTQA